MLQKEIFVRRENKTILNRKSACTVEIIHELDSITAVFYNLTSPYYRAMINLSVRGSQYEIFRIPFVT